MQANMNQDNSMYMLWRRVLNAAFTGFMWVFLVTVFVVTAYPLWYVFIYSISDPAGFTTGFQLIPHAISLRAYETILGNDNFLSALFISVARTTVGPVLSGIITMMIAYAVSHRELPGRRLLNWSFLFTMYFGAGLIPTYLLYRSLGFVGSFWVYIVPSLVNVYGMILMRTYIESLPAELKESAFIDGANDFTIFHKIIVPLCLPVIAAVTLFACVNQWNSYTDTVIYNATAQHLHPLQYFLVRMVSNAAGAGSADIAAQLAMQAGEQGRARLSPMVVRMAVTIVTIVPISLLYPFLQRYFVKGLMVGAVKG
jgi:putative aldouronate transport system permease protein